ncbi:MAG TPA: hypothetical protein VEY07_05020 [Thermoplasmata archaeon]|nr:hypothetical protein [Thermoplasmata archaeon]
MGAGIVLELGAWAEAAYRPGGPRRLRVRSTTAGPLPISRDVARRLAAGRRGELTVRLHHELPVGQGFGMSAAGALATALAVAKIFRIPSRRAIEVAHLSDLFGLGGLGGVASILGGGWERRERPGIPPFGWVVHRPFRPPIWLIPLGPPLPSPRLLGNRRFLDRVRDAAEAGLGRLDRSPTTATFLEESERFADRLGLAPATLGSMVRALRQDGARASQAMFGQCVWAVAPTPAVRARLVAKLVRLRLRGVEVRAAHSGARSRIGRLPAGKGF